DRGVRGEGAVVGAVVGATAGGAIGRSTARCGQVQGSYDPYYGQAQNQYPQNEPYYGEDDLYGGPYEETGYYGDANRDCRMGEQIVRDPYGREYREDVMMCRGRDGVWRRQ